MAPFAEYRLPPGRHGLSDEHVHANQRWRLLGACAEVLAGEGYGALTVTAVSRSAAVSRVTFYKHFDGLRECILATHEMAAQAAIAVARDTCKGAADPATALSEAVGSLLELLASEPALAHVLTDQALNDVPGLWPPVQSLPSAGPRCWHQLGGGGWRTQLPTPGWRCTWSAEAGAGWRSACGRRPRRHCRRGRRNWRSCWPVELLASTPADFRLDSASQICVTFVPEEPVSK